MASGLLFRVSVAVEQIWLVCAVAVALILCVLLRPVSKKPCFAGGVFQLGKHRCRFALFLAPTYAAMIFPILVLAFIGETSLCLWLIVKGVNVPKWQHQASVGRAA